LTISAFGYEAWIDVKDTMSRASVRFYPTAGV